MDRTNKKGFTLIELLVVIAIIALLLSIVLPSLNRAKSYARRIICGNHLRQQSLGITLYAEQHDSRVPWTLSGWWLWDVSFWSTEQIMHYAGFGDEKVFFCPENPFARPGDARYWQFSWLPGTHSNPVSIRDESGLSLTERQYTHYRVLPYVYMLQKYNSSNQPQLGDTLVTGERAKWISRLSAVRNAGSTEMVVDAVIAATNPGQPRAQFFEITVGGIDDLSNGMLMDTSNHRSRHTITTGNYQGSKPEGGNAAYADGHVSWDIFGSPPPNSDMQWRYTTGGIQFWW